MPYDPRTGQYRAENASVERRVVGLLSKDSDLMKQAGTQGKASAARRGLLNSSMGVQAGQASRVAAAVPIASQDAGQAHQTNLQGRELQSMDIRQGRDIESREGMHSSELENRERMQGVDVQNQQTIAQMNVAASERQAASQMAAQFDANYSNMVSNLMNNPDIPADVRQRMLDHYASVRDSNFAMVEQMYGIDLDWGSTPGGSGAGTGAGSAGAGAGTGAGSGTGGRNTPGAAAGATAGRPSAVSTGAIHAGTQQSPGLSPSTRPGRGSAVGSAGVAATVEPGGLMPGIDPVGPDGRDELLRRQRAQQR